MAFFCVSGHGHSLDVEVGGIPEELDISELRGRGLQPGEEELPEGGPPPAVVAVEIDESIVEQLVEMGFDKEGCKKAVFNTSNQGESYLLSSC